MRKTTKTCIIGYVFIGVLLFGTSCEKNDNIDDNNIPDVNTFIDNRDGTTYKTVTIGNQIWMAENLKYLPKIHSNSEYEEASLNSEAGFGVYGYDGSDINSAKEHINYNIYGVIYNWWAAMNSDSTSNTNPSNVQGICPEGWHLPSDAEWSELIEYLSGANIAGGKLKEAGTTHWQSPNTGATNETGFTALPGGFRSKNGVYNNIKINGCWWSATDYSSNNSWYRYLFYGDSIVGQSNEGFHKIGFSVRCLQE